ncbi:MAG: Uncharacterised protein [Gammaproteobacteria bacterium]|nr:MAG: Uncharacterised protein [Gammaproteobacteria bacterium]|tara:strand:+ start:1262 stop:1489 length:228 start_codon:yes stop_codon:yes gene_type:complete
MIKDKYYIISKIEIFIQSYNHEYQSIGNEIKIYLEESEISIVIDKYINIYTHDNDEPFSYPTLDKALLKLKTIIS